MDCENEGHFITSAEGTAAMSIAAPPERFFCHAPL